MQTITITGYLSRDAEQRQTRDGTAITNWNVPVKQGWGENERTNWFRVAIFGKRADFAAKCRKGEFVAVTGELTIGEYDGKAQYEIRAADFQTVNMNRTPDGSQGGPINTGKPAFADDLDDQIPFLTRDSIW